jgi:N-acetylglutamate synthase-like GNAT family acetyltransferase
VWALGDCARVPNLATPGEFDPPTSQHSLRQARRLARNLTSGEIRPYRYRMLGQVATLGRHKGIADVLGLRLRGFPAGGSRARTTSTSCRSRHGRPASSSTGRSRSSSGATSPSSARSAIRGGWAMNEELARAWAFMRRGDAAGDTEEPARLGVAVRDSRFPRREDSNYLLVARPATGADIAVELRRLGLPVATVADESLLLDESGAEVAHRGLVMVHRGAVPEARREAVEVEREALEPLRRGRILSQPWGSPEVADQLLAARTALEERVTVRYFASLENGEVAAGTDLYLGAPDAQIEDVSTEPELLNRGHGTAVVVAAVAAAREAGADFVFLVADAGDWPKDWYARLGFEPVGRYVKLRAPTEGP